jgi:hypothetical protein
MLEDEIEKARQDLRQYAEPLCKKAVDTELPPLQEINHRIPIIDPKKHYSWRPSKCPEPMRHLWAAKRDAYLKTGQ